MLTIYSKLRSVRSISEGRVVLISQQISDGPSHMVDRIINLRLESTKDAIALAIKILKTIPANMLKCAKDDLNLIANYAMDDYDETAKDQGTGGSVVEQTGT